MLLYFKKCLILLFACLLIAMVGYTQAVHPGLTPVSKSEHTSVKNQANTGTCWSFSMVSLIESQSLKNGLGQFDLSEMFIVRNIYVEKAKNYVFRQGAAQFGPGGLGHDVIRAIDRYGAVPENVYSGLTLGKAHDHSKLDEALKAYLDNLLKNRPIPADWLTKFETILDDHLGKVPDTFIVGEKQYTPRTFARDVLQFRASDYVALTSFTHHPFYQPFILEVPDNFSNGVYYNLPLNELLGVTRQAVANGYSIMWDADVSNPFFRQKEGIAMQLKDDKNLPKVFSPDDEEIVYDEEMRQRLFENLATQDDHLMHLVGVERSKSGKTFYLVKNSWGEVGPYKGFIHVSEAYFAINTISLVMPKAALDKLILMKLGL